VALRPITPPRRDEIALGKSGAFSQRAMVYLENVSETINESPQAIEDDVVASLGGESQAGIAMFQGVETAKLLKDSLNIIAQIQADGGSVHAMISELEKPISNIFNLVAGLFDSVGILVAENDKIKKEISDLKQLHGGF